MSETQRQKQFVDSKVQGALARRIVTHWIALFVITAVTTFVLQVLSNPFRPPTEHMRDIWWTHGPLLVVMVFLLPVFVHDTIKLSHRFAGPVIRLRTALRQVAGGHKPQRIQFRDSDFWKELAMDFNRAVDRFEEAGAVTQSPLEAPSLEEELQHTS